MNVERPGRIRRFLVLLVGMALVAGCVGPREGAAPSVDQIRTKNNSLASALSGLTTLLKLTSSNTMSLTTTMGSIGYAIRVNFTGADPAFDVTYGTSTVGCSVDAVSGVLSYSGAVRGTCSVWAAQPDAKRGGTGVVTFVPPVVPSVLSKDLVAYFPFNDAASLGWNSVTNKVDLTASGGAVFRSQGRFGGGVYFNGRDGMLVARSNSNKSGSLTNLPSGNTPYAVSAWIKPTEFRRGGIAGWGKFDGKTASGTVLLRMNDNLQPATTNTISGGLVHVWWGKDLVYKHNEPVCCTAPFTEDKWAHVAITYDGKTRTIYYRGKAWITDEPKIANAVTNENFRLGGSMGGVSDFFTGKMDDVAVWKRALTAQEVAALANGPVASPASELGADFVPFVPTPCSEWGGYCDVGDKAPDGGTVFYVGNFVDQLTSQPMQYIAYAPSDLMKQVHGPGTSFLTGYETNCGGKVHPIPETDKRDIGFGRRNTQLITQFCRESAAARAMALDTGGSKDWFIPSDAELNELCKFVRNQVTGDPSIGCSSSFPLPDGWAMDRYHGYFLSSSQGAIVDEYVALFTTALASLGQDWLTGALAVANKAGAFANVNWGGLQAWRLGRDFLSAKRYNDDGQASQVRPVRYFAPGAQRPLDLAPATGTVGRAIDFSVSGGSGSGALTYRVTDAGTASCSTNAERTQVTAQAVGKCSVVASKAGSGSFRVARTAAVEVTVARGEQTPLSLATPSIFVGDATTIAISGGNGGGATSVKVADAGATACRVANPAAGSTQVVADAPGTCRVTLDKAGDANYLPAASLTIDVRVTKKNQASLSVAPASGAIDTEVSLSASGGSGAGAVTFAVSPGGTSDCVLAPGGTSVTAQRPGTCLVTATKAGDANFGPTTSTAVEVGFSVIRCNDNGQRSDGSVCQVGDVGPGGGRVFYVSPTPINYADQVSSGGTLLEVAPSGWWGSPGEYKNQWCRSGVVGTGLKSGIGDGADNTFRVEMAGNCAQDSAIKKVLGATIGGKDDWFLPSARELNEVCKFAYRQTVGDPSVDCKASGPIRADFGGLAGRYERTFSSTEVVGGGYTSNQTLEFGTGPGRFDLANEGTGWFAFVRPIRAFGANKPPTTVPAAGLGSTTLLPPTTSTIPVDWVCDNTGKRQDGSPCQVGDTGPAGGRVIHATTVVLNVAAGISTGGRYYELAPSGWNGTAKDPKMALGCSSGSIKTDLGIGASTTKAMIDACAAGSGAVQAAANLSLTRNGVVYSDWFLPSRGEVVKISETKVANLGLEMRESYWTSSLMANAPSLGMAWTTSISFDWPGAVSAGVAGSTSAFVRPIRVFG